MSDARAKLNALSEPFPPQAIEKREGGGGKMLDYVATETVIRRLNNRVGVWDFKITDTKVMPAGDAQLLVIWGEMTIPGLGTRAGTGVQVIHPRGGEDMWKGAASDCLKKCATLFGVGIDLYGPDLEAGELPQQNNVPPRARNTSQNTVVGTHAEPVDGWTGFWAAARRAGLADKAQVEAAIGQLGADPQEALNRLNAKMSGQPVQQQAPMHAPPPTNGQAATPKQIHFIQVIAREHGMGEDQLAAEVEELYGRPLDQLDRRDASAYIERLQSRRNVTEIAS